LGLSQANATTFSLRGLERSEGLASCNVKLEGDNAHSGLLRLPS
jgi:hypothetical protein